MLPSPSVPKNRPRLLAWVTVCLGCIACATATWAATIDDGCDGPRPTWTIGDSNANARVIVHERSSHAPHRGDASERFVIDAAVGTTLTVQLPIGNAAVIDEVRASVWVRANRPNIRVAMRVMLPAFPAAGTGRPVEVLIPGTTSRDVDRWQRLEVANLPAMLARSLPALRAQHGPHGSLDGAVATHMILELYSSPGRYEVFIDDLLVEGVIDRGDAHTAIGRELPAADADAGGPSEPPRDASRPSVDPPSGLHGGVFEVAGLPFFPRAIDHHGEPLERIAAMGFNCVRLRGPASGELIEEARQNNLWIICPPPALPDADVDDPDSLPILSRNWDRVLMWDMGSGLSAQDEKSLAKRRSRVRACDQHAGRPLIASADSGVRAISRHVDMLVARRSVLGTSLELPAYQTWLRERSRLMRPGTPLLAAISTEIDPQTARQAASLAGIGGSGLAVDPESLSLAAMTSVAAGVRGILFSSSRRIDGTDTESRTRAVAAQSMNLRLALVEPWGAAGRFASSGQTSDPEVQTAVLEAARARLVLAWRTAQGSQIVARHYHGDIPDDSTPLTVLVPGMPEAHKAWEVGPTGLRPLTTRRITGGVSVTLESFHSQAMVLVSGEPAVTGHIQERIRSLAPLTLASARARAALVLAAGGELLGRLPSTALGTLPAASMLSTAQREAVEAESLVAADPATAVTKFQRAIAIGSQLERLAWERGVLATGSLVASPLSTSDATLAEHWRFIDALTGTSRGPSLLPGGAMERLDELASTGWRHFAVNDPSIRTSVELTRTEPFAGAASLTMRAAAAKPDEPAIVVETPPVWITTPPVQAPPGKLLEIEARVSVDDAIAGSVDGLLVFDSIGGPALAERVGKTNGWQRLVLYRIAPPDTTEPLVVTFALTGLGTARLDDVAVRVVERGGGGTPANMVSTSPQNQSNTGFARPTELLGPGTVPQPPLPAPRRVPPANPSEAPTASAPSWPGMGFEWPKLLPFTSPNEPPAGPEGGTIDPFKRARGDG